jgi:hypothetical protein
VESRDLYRNRRELQDISSLPIGFLREQSEPTGDKTRILSRLHGVISRKIEKSSAI